MIQRDIKKRLFSFETYCISTSLVQGFVKLNQQLVSVMNEPFFIYNLHWSSFLSAELKTDSNRQGQGEVMDELSAGKINNTIFTHCSFLLQKWQHSTLMLLEQVRLLSLIIDKCGVVLSVRRIPCLWHSAKQAISSSWKSL